MSPIVKAAIRFQGKVYTGWRHCSIIRDIVEQTGCKRVCGEQGFIVGDGSVLDEGTFVGREEACRIAREAGQGKIKEGQQDLFSEDVWDKNGQPVSQK